MVECAILKTHIRPRCVLAAGLRQSLGGCVKLYFELLVLYSDIQRTPAVRSTTILLLRFTMQWHGKSYRYV